MTEWAKVWPLMILWVVGCTSLDPLGKLTTTKSHFLPSGPGETYTLSGIKDRDGGAVYVLSPGDMIEIKFYYNPELNSRQRIRPDGKISLQLIDDVQAAGYTPMELDRLLTAKYQEKLERPELSVMVVEFANRMVYVGGEVRQPRVINLWGRMTALQAIFEAGGPKDTAQMKNIIIIRYKGDQQYDLLTMDLSNLQDRTTDFLLQPYDIVYVPKTTIARADAFVNQYIDQILPDNLALPFTFLYQIRRPRTNVDFNIGQ